MQSLLMPLFLLILLAAACSAGAYEQPPGGPEPANTPTAPKATGSSTEGDLADHYFHHPFTTDDPLLERAIQLALADKQVQEELAGKRHAVVNAHLTGEDKYRPCSEAYRCAFVLINYGSASLGAAVDLEKDEVWDISERSAPALPVPIVGMDEAKETAEEHFRQQRGQEPDVERTYVKGTMSLTRESLCDYHGCWAVVVSSPDGNHQLMAVDRTEPKVIETVQVSAGTPQLAGPTPTPSPQFPPPPGPPTPTPTPTPYPVVGPPPPTATPVVIDQGRQLPAAVPTQELTSRVSTVTHWQPQIAGPLQALAIVNESYAMAASGSNLLLLGVDASGMLRPLETVAAVRGTTTALYSSGTLLAALVSGEDPGLLLYDIRDASAPQFLGQYRGDFQRGELADGYAYLAAGDDGLHIVDISAPRNPQQAAHLPVWTEEERHDHGGGSATITYRSASIKDVRVAGELAYVAAYQMGLVIFDVADPTSPRLLGQYRTPGYASRVAVGEGYAIVANNVITPFTIWVVDIQDPANPQPVGNHQDKMVNARVQQVEVAGDRAYFLVASSHFGGTHSMLSVLDVSDPEAPALLAKYLHSGFARQMTLQGDLAYIADSQGIATVAVGQEATNLLSRLPAGVPAVAVHARDSYVFAFTRSGLHVVDLAAPDGPQEVATLDLDGRGPNRIEDDTAYFFLDRHQERPLDLSDPTSPGWGTPAPRQAGSWGQATIGPYSYSYFSAGHSQPWSGLKVYLHRQGEAKETGEVPLAPGPLCCGSAIAVSDHYIYVAGNHALYILDASDPASPHVIARKPLTSQGKTPPFIRVHNGKAYVLQGGLWVLDLADPEAPAVVAYHPSEATTLDVSEGRVYLLGPEVQLEVVRVSEAP